MTTEAKTGNSAALPKDPHAEGSVALIRPPRKDVARQKCSERCQRSIYLQAKTEAARRSSRSVENGGYSLPRPVRLAVGTHPHPSKTAKSAKTSSLMEEPKSISDVVR